MNQLLRRRAADWAEYYGGTTSLWLTGYALVVGVLLAVALFVDSIPWWGILGFIPLIGGTAALVNGVTSGYRPATPAEAQEIRSGNLWHVTSAETVYDPTTGTATLDSANCRWIAKMRRSDRPFTRRRPAVYAFTNRPRPGQMDIHIRRHQRAHLLRLDAAAANGQIYISRGGAIALPDGYCGPAQLERPPPRNTPVAGTDQPSGRCGR